MPTTTTALRSVVQCVTKLAESEGTQELGFHSPPEMKPLLKERCVRGAIKRRTNEVPIQSDVDNETWIQWARPVWLGIRESDTLNVAMARDEKDERHIAPLQLGLIERCVRLWSNEGELVLSPFGGIGSEGVVSIRRGRRFIGCELKPQYWKVACRNLEDAEAECEAPSLWDS